MTPLHIPSLLAVLVLGFVVLSLQLWLARKAPLPKAEMRAVMLLACCFLVGFAFLGLRPWLPLWVSVLVGGGALCLGVTCLTEAVFQHVLNRALPRGYWPLPVLFLVLMLALLQQPQAVRTAVLSLVLAAQLAPAVWVALRQGWHTEAAFRMVGISLAVAWLALAARGVDALLRPESYRSLMSDGLATGLTFLFAFMSLLGAGFGFLLAGFERMARQMEHLATTDGLTGCANHKTTVALLAHGLERGRREGRPLAVLMLDLDHFKLVNDQHGHAVGDQVLRDVAACVRQRLRSSDVFGRLGGEEFALVLPSTEEAGALAVAEQLRVAVAALVHTGDAGGRFHVTTSIGVAMVHPAQAYSPEEALQLADRALYLAKSRGRNRVELADPWMLNSSMMDLKG